MRATTLVVLGVLAIVAATAFADKTCDECWGKTSGPCRHDLDWSCMNYMSGTTCPPGSHECGPIDCEVSEWGSWSKCDAECDGGSQSRSRKIVTHASHGGAKCPVLTEWRSCNTDKCEKDKCIVTEWSEWSKCTKTCGGGSSTRTRKVVSGFKNCPALSETSDCNTHDCNGCGGCFAGTSGPCMHQAKGDNTCTGYYAGTQQCPVGFSACSVTKNSLEILGGKPGNGKCTGCFGKSEGPCMHDKAPVCHNFFAGTTTCPPGTSLCGPVNCEVSAWSKWSKCSASCGGGSQSRSRTVTVQPKNGGTACPALAESQDCNTHACIPKCNACTGKSAGPCQHVKDNTCFSYMKEFPGKCPPGTTECAEVDCVVSEWTNWSKCTASCGGGSQFRSRSVKVAPTPGGKQCPALEESQTCNTHKCDHCTGCVGKSAGPCQNLANGVCYEHYKGTTDCPAGTVACAGKKTFAVQGGSPGTGECELCFGKSAGPCRHNADNSCHQFIPKTTTCPAGTTLCGPVDCEVSAWSKFSKCSHSCGGGSMTRTRTITVHPQNGGAACPALEDTESCNKFACKPKCNECTLGTSGPCQHDKDNTCFDYFTKGGLHQCPAGTHECVVQDCEVSSWSAWGKCSAACNGGSQSRSRKVVKSPSPGGAPCPALSEDQACNTQKCAHCAGCAGKSSGPCRHDANFVCHDYYEGTTNCPAGTTECSKKGLSFGALGGKAGNAGDGMCSGCFGKSAGPCRHVKDTSCYGYMAGTTTCPPGTAPCAPVNCEVSEWTAWSKCSKQCGGGSSERSRSITVHPSNGGMACPHLEESNACNTHKCPVACTECGGKSAGPCRHDKDGTCHNFNAGTTDCPAGTTVCEEKDCMVSDWSKWSKCSANCGGGTQTRSRIVVQAPTPNGAACPALSDTQSCNTHKCDGCTGCAGKSSGPCKNGHNSVCYDYYKGTTTCPSGTDACAKTKSTFSVQGGKPGNGMCTGCFGKSAGPCRHVKDTSCYAYMSGTTCPPGTAPCAPIDCQVSKWSAWSKCSAKCGGGVQSRSRKVTVAPSNGGAACPALSEEQSCNTQACPPVCTDCFGKSSGPCQHDKDNTCFNYGKDGNCPAGTHLCIDIDCVVSQWSNWNKCSAKCGGGLQSRSRSILTHPAGNGAACPELDETRDCNTHDCNSCSGCVGGTSGPCQHDKDGSCFSYFPGTKNCPPGSTACTVKKTDFETLGGKPGSGMCTGCFGKSAGPCQHDKDSSCHGFFAGTTTCPPGTHVCAPVNCQVTAWSAWSKCSASCGGGMTSRTRDVKVPASNGGAACPSLEEFDTCNTHACPIKCADCAAGTSGPCQHDKDGTCFAFFTKGGLSQCPAGTHECYPVDCEVSAWSKWGKCSATCGGGVQSRSRVVKQQPLNGGAACPALEDSQACNTHKCTSCTGCIAKTDGPCKNEANSVCYGYNEGTTTCPAGTTKCTKTFGSLGGAAGAPGNGVCSGCVGKSEGPCQHDKDNTCFGWLVGNDGTCPPGTHLCGPVDCEVSAWSKWSKCSAECGGGVQTRSRSITVQPQNGGMKCPDLNDSQDCNTQACKPVCVDCAGKSAGPCQHDKDNTCHQRKGGECPPGTHECAVPVDCEVTAWSKWSACDAKCDGGSQSRSRSIKVHPANGGKACPALSESQSCNKHSCFSCSACLGKSEGPCQNPHNSVCYDYYKGTSTCPAGTIACAVSKKSFGDLTAFGGKGSGKCGACNAKTSGPCKHLNDDSCFDFFPGTTMCPPGTAPCTPVNCEVSAWSKWSKCSADCDGGVQTRSRIVKVAPMNGGAACPDLSESQDCNTQACKPVCVDCAGKSAGPCQHDKDNTCHQRKGGECPPGTHECAVPVDCVVSDWSKWSKCSANCGGGLTNRARTVKVEAANGGKACPHLSETEKCNTTPCKNCANCAGKSEGPCQHNANSVCHGYYHGTEICPAGTTPCKAAGKSLGILGGAKGNGNCDACVGKSEGPCKSADGVCFDFYPGTTMCPAGTTGCKPGSCVVSEWTAWSKCSASCNGGSRSRSRKIVSHPTNGGAKCPATTETEACNTHKCGAKKEEAGKCGKCAGVSSGPCRQVKDNVCHNYYKGTTTCPSGTEACVLCTVCNDKTAGPCQHDVDNSCHAYLVGTTCPPGTHACGDKSSGGNTGGNTGSADVCTGCWPGTAGPCQQKNTVCHDYFPGTKTCPGGTTECKKAGSLAPKDLVVFDAHFDEAVNAEHFAAQMAAATGRDDSYVVVDSAVSSDSGSDFGFVVVTKDGESVSDVTTAVAAALETNQAGAAFAGMNKPAEVSMSSQALAAPGAGTGLSSAMIALIAVGAVAGVAIIVGIIVVAKRGRTGLMRTSSSKVMNIRIPSEASIVKPRGKSHVTPTRARDLDSDDE